MSGVGRMMFWNFETIIHFTYLKQPQTTTLQIINYSNTTSHLNAYVYNQGWLEYACSVVSYMRLFRQLSDVIYFITFQVAPPQMLVGL